MITALSISAQSKLNLSLDDAIHMAMQNNITYNLKKTETQVAKQKIISTQMANIPDIYGTSNLQNNLIVASTPVPAKMFNTNAADNEITPMKFGTNWTANMGINMQYDIFNPEKYNDTKKSKINLQIANVAEEIERINLASLVSIDYGTSLIAKQQILLASDDTSRMHALYSYMKAKHEEGKSTIEDLNQSLIDVNNAKARWIEADNVYKKSIATLLNDMGIVASAKTIEDTKLTNDLDELLKQAQNNDLSDNKLALVNKKSELQIQSIETELQSVQLKYLPTLSVSGFYGTNFFGNKLNLTDSNRWFGNSFIAVGIKIPISNALHTDSETKINRLNVEKARMELKNNMLLHDFNIVQYKQDMESKRESFSIKQENIRLANESYEANAQSFKEGRLLHADLQKSHYAVIQAETDYLQAIYDYFQAWINYKKSLAL